MKRMLWAVAVMGLAAAGARADWGGFQPPVPQAPQQAGYGEFNSPHTLSGLAHGHANKAPDRYGLLPGLRKAFRLEPGCDTCGNGGKPGLFSKGNGGCANGNCGNGGYGGYDYQPYQYPPPMQGTLVFPNHQFIRSPRDFFMYEPGR